MSALEQVKHPSTAREGQALRAAVAIAVALAAAIAAFTIAAGVTGSLVAAVPIAVVAGGLVAVRLWKRPIVSYDPAATSRPLRVVSAVATLAALVQLARLTVFIMAPAQAAYSQFPSSVWEKQHSCLTAYFVAAQAIATTPNVYDDALFSLPGDPTAIRKPRTMGLFKIDAYEYPPPFLLLPRALGLVAPDFSRLRLAWFGICAGVLLLGMLAVARALGPVVGTRALLLAPLVWAGIPTLNVLQKGNVQVLVIAISMCAMLLFERRRWAAGGSLLAYATVSKLYPGMLVLYLLCRRQWRAVAWTAVLSGVVVLLSLLDTGIAPLAAFLHELPAILGGEAFPAFRNPAATAINLSVPGIVFKLKLFGVAGMSFATAKVVGWVYTLVVIGAIALVARRPIRDDEAPAVWLAVLILATLRSPFLPQGYGVLPAIWLLTLLAARRPPTSKNLLLLVLAWVGLNIYVPMDWGVPPRLLAVVNLLPQVATIAIAVLALRRPSAAAATATGTATAAA
jgi:alpha-1,2-mannosyltransferase